MQESIDEIDGGVVEKLSHYKSMRMFQLWEILGLSPLFSDADREKTNQALLEYLTYGTGVRSVDRFVEAAEAPGIFDRSSTI